MSDSCSEQIIELDRLIGLATIPDIKKLLIDYKSTVEAKQAYEEVDVCSSTEKVSASSTDSATTKTTTIATAASAVTTSTSLFVAPGSTYYHPIDSFSWDQSDTNAQLITIYVDLDDVGSIDKVNVQCTFSKDAFTLTVQDLKGKNYKLVQDNLEKDIQPDICTYIIKKSKVVIKLKKAKGDNEYSPYDRWNNLLSKKSREQKEADKQKKKDPNTALQSMLKDMYDDGDDKMKALIGEAMLKGRDNSNMNTGLPKKAGSSLDNADFDDI